MIRMFITILISINLFYLAFAQDTIEGRWHLVGYEENVMYQFEDNYRYSIYSLDGAFGSLEDAGGSPNPYTLEEDIITIDLFFGIIVNYQMNFMCDGQVVEFKNIDYGTIHSTHFREGYDYEESPCNNGECIITGCSSQICAEEPTSSDCAYLDWYVCFQYSECGNYGLNGNCIWLTTDSFLDCLDSFGITVGCTEPEACNYDETSNVDDGSCEYYYECEGCCYEELLANENCDGTGCFIPQCTENCEWEPIQCWGSTGYCWCVDENGIEIEGTSQPSSEGFPDCEEINLGSTINIPYDYPSIQDGIDAASDGDTILVHPGTYYGPIDFNRKNLVIGSLLLLDADESFISQTIIMGAELNESPFVQIDGISEPEVELNGFTFQDISLNTFAEGTQSYVLINIMNASPKIINNRFNNFQIEGQAESAVIFCNSSSSLIENNTFSDGMIALNYELTGWILSKNSSLTIKNNRMENGYVGFSEPTGYVVSIASENIISGNTFNNISMGYCWTCAAIVALDGSSLIISNNLILRATGDGYGAILASESEYVSNNNTLVDNRGGYANIFSNGIVKNDIMINYSNGWGNSITLDAYSTIQISYSNIEGGYEGEGNIDINPLFNETEIDDYTLQSESPCIDTGIADLDGDGIDDIINYNGLAPDMGAYEYVSEYNFDLGDVNFDHEINILDVVLLVSFILGESSNEYELSAGDINHDGFLNILDVVALINIILGK